MLTAEPIQEDDDNEENGAIMADPMGPKTPSRSKGKGRKRDRYQDLSSEQLIPSPPPPPPKPGLAGIPGMPTLSGMAGSGSARKLMEGAASKLRRRQKTAMTLRVVRKWLMKIIYAQAAGNLLRALPIFILEKYLIMLLIFFQVRTIPYYHTTILQYFTLTSL